MKSILSIGLLAVIALILHHALIEKPEMERRQKHEIEMARLERLAAPQPVVTQVQDPKRVRGKVIARGEDYVVVRCEPVVIPPRPNRVAFDGGPAMGSAATKRIAAIAAQQERAYEEALAAAAQSAEGEVRVYALSAAVGETVDTRAIPHGQGAFIHAVEEASESRATPLILNIAQPSATPMPGIRPLTPGTPRPLRSAAEENAEIVRKYGSR